MVARKVTQRGGKRRRSAFQCFIFRPYVSLMPPSHNFFYSFVTVTNNVAVQALERMRTPVTPRLTESFRGHVFGQCLLGGAGLTAFTICGLSLHLGLATVSCLYLLIIFAMALFCGFWQASVVSVLAVICLDYFFTLPLFRFDITNPQDWVSLGTFEAAALIISRLSTKESRSAREAEVHRAGMEQLYELSRSSLLLDLREPPGPQLVVLIQRVFHAQAVALYDVNLGRVDKAGEWAEEESGYAKDCFLQERSSDDPRSNTSARVLRGSQGPVGALVLRGRLRPVVVDALTALAATAIDRFQSFEKEERAENASKSEQLRAAVMDALAHEFKTPLSTVQTASMGLLDQGGLSERQSELAALIEGEVARMNELCTRLLLTAKLEAENVGLETAEVNIQEFMNGLLIPKPGHQERNKVTIRIEDPSITLRVDRGLLAMILNQYIDNARKYSKPGTPIEIGARRSYSEILFSVHNFGPVIRLEDRERIFDRFYRSPDHVNSVAGTGIGLSVVRKAATAHHGHVWVVSDKDEGTTFFLSLPLDARSSQ
jgi:two-component system sensor histidine kinase KdpD